MPPRVPKGSPSTRKCCCSSCAARKVSETVVGGGLPTAKRLMARLATKYRSSKAWDIRNTPPILSNPKLASSAGRKSSTSISSANKSRIALRYSARFSRWKVAVRPGSGSADQFSSSRLSSHARNPSSRALSGRGRPAGGMRPARSFRTTCSQCAADPPTADRSSVSRVSPTARSWDTKAVRASPLPSTNA